MIGKDNKNNEWKSTIKKTNNKIIIFPFKNMTVGCIILYEYNVYFKVYNS